METSAPTFDASAPTSGPIQTDNDIASPQSTNFQDGHHSNPSKLGLNYQYSSSSTLTLLSSTTSDSQTTPSSPSSSPASSAPAPISLGEVELELVPVDVALDLDLDVASPIAIRTSKPIAIPGDHSSAQGFLSSTPTGTLRSNGTLKPSSNQLNRVSIVDDIYIEDYMDMEFGVFARREHSVELMENVERLEADVPLSVRASFVDAEIGVEAATANDHSGGTSVEDQLLADGSSPLTSTSPKRNTRLERWIEQQSDLWVPSVPPALSNSTSTSTSTTGDTLPRESIRISGIVNSAATFAVKRKESLREQRQREEREKDVVTPTPQSQTIATSALTNESPTSSLSHATTAEAETESPLLTTPLPSPLSPSDVNADSVNIKPITDDVTGIDAPVTVNNVKWKQIAPTLITPTPALNTNVNANVLGGVPPLSPFLSTQNLGSTDLSISPLLVPTTSLSPNVPEAFSFPPSVASSRRNSHSNPNPNVNSNPITTLGTNGAYLTVPPQDTEAARADSPLLGCWGIDVDVDKPLPLPPAPSPSPPTSTTGLPTAGSAAIVPSIHQPAIAQPSPAAAQYEPPQPQFSTVAGHDFPIPIASRIPHTHTHAPLARPKTAPHSKLSPPVSPFGSPSPSPMIASFVPASLSNVNIYGKHSPHSSGSGMGNFTQLPIGVSPGSSFTTAGFAASGLNGQTHSRSGSGTTSPARRYSHQTLQQNQSLAAQFSQYSFGASGSVATSNSPPMSVAPSRKGSLLRGVKEEENGAVVERAVEKLQDSPIIRDTRPPLQGLRSRSYSTTLSGLGQSNGAGLRPSTSSGLLGSGYGQPQAYFQPTPTPTPTTSPPAQFHLPTGMLHKSQSLAQLNILANTQPLGVQSQQQSQPQQTPLPPSSPPTRRLSRIPPAAQNLNSMLLTNPGPAAGSKTHSYNSSVVSLTGLPEEESFVSSATSITTIQPISNRSHTVDPSASLSPVRNAVYIDSELMKEKLDELLEMAKMEIEAAESNSVAETSTEGEEDTIEGFVDHWTYSYSNTHSRSNSVPLSRVGSVSASVDPSGYSTPYSAGGLRKHSANSSSSENPIPFATLHTPSTPPPTIRPQGQQYISSPTSHGPPPNTPMTAYFSLSSGSPASTGRSAGGFYMSPEASSSQVYVGNGSSGTHSRAGSKESAKGGGASVGMTTTNTTMRFVEANADPSSVTTADVTLAATSMINGKETSSTPPIRPPPAPPLDIGEVVENLADVEKLRSFGAAESVESHRDAYGGFEEEFEGDFSDGEEEDLSTSDEEMMDDALALARELGVGNRMVFNGRRSFEGMFEDGGDGWEEFEDEEMGVGMVDVNVGNPDDRFATARRRSILLTSMAARNGSGSLRRKSSVRRTSIVGSGGKRNGSISFTFGGGGTRRRGSSAAGRGRPGNHPPTVAAQAEERAGDLDGVDEDEEFGLMRSLAPPSRWSLTSSIQADEKRSSVEGKPVKKKRRSFVPFVGSGDKDKEREKEKEELPTTTSPKESITGKKRNRLASFISRLSGVGVGGSVGAPTMMAAGMDAGSSPASPQLVVHTIPPLPISFADKNGSGLLASPVIISKRDSTPSPAVPLSPKQVVSPRGLSIDVQAATNFVPPSSIHGNSKSVPNSPLSPRARLPAGIVIPPVPTRPTPTPPGTSSAPAFNTLAQPHSPGLWDAPSPVSPSTITPLPSFNRVRSNSAADLLSMRRPTTSHTSAAINGTVSPTAAAFAHRPTLMKSASASALGLHQQVNRMKGNEEEMVYNGDRPGTPTSIASTDEYGNERDSEERVSPSQPSPEAERIQNALNALSSHQHLAPPLAPKSQGPPPATRPRLKSMTSLVNLPSGAANNSTIRSKSGFRGLVERMRGNSSAANTAYNSPVSSSPSTPNVNGGGTSPQPPLMDDNDLFAPGPDPFARETPTPTHSPSASFSVTPGVATAAGIPVGIGGILGRKSPKRKLMITGVALEDVEAYEAVKSWCESFGELREVTRAPNGAMYVDFRKASVADTVCRVQAQVFIKGAGSVALSWYTKKRPT